MEKLKIGLKVVLIICLFIGLTGCADTTSFLQAGYIDPVGFWYGLWHGVILPFSWIGSLFSEDIAVYAIYNNGGWYDFGFVIGVGGLVGSSS